MDRRVPPARRPAYSVLSNERYVLAVKDERTVRVPVKVGLDDGARVEVIEGLVEGTSVVVKPGGLGAGLDVKTTEQK